MATPRAIRIPRAPSALPSPPPPSPGPATPELPAEGSPAPVDRRRNQAATERASRLAVIYLGALLVLYIGFVLLDRASPGGTSSAAETGVGYFTAITAVVGLVGTVVALSPAPRSVEVRADSFVVQEWTGRRRTFPPLGELRVSVVRRYPRSFLSSRPVEMLELGTLAGGRRSYQFEEGLIPTPEPEWPARRV